MKLEGTYPALITPFKAEKGLTPAVDYEALREHVEWQLECGVAGVVACGTSGESATLSGEERANVIRHVVEQVDSRVPVIAGTGTNATRSSIDATIIAREIGVDAALVVSPYYNKPTQEGLFQHFSTVADEGGLPVILYNIPGRTGVEIEIETFERLAKNPNIIAVKESTQSAVNMMALNERVGDALTVLSGEDQLVHLIMAAGGKGVISASANVVPEQFVAITNAALNKDWETSLQLQNQVTPLVRALFLEANPSPAKAALKLLGRLQNDIVRLPLVSVTDETRTALARELDVAEPAKARLSLV